jgi:hypothetical protein
VNEMRLRSQNIGYPRGVLISNACAAIAFAILAPLLAANLAESHTSSFLIAVVTSIWALPSVIGGPLFTRLIARFNARICLLLIGVFCYVSTLLTFPVFRDVWVWIALQLVGGVMVGHFFLVTEAWLNHFSAESFRGRWGAFQNESCFARQNDPPPAVGADATEEEVWRPTSRPLRQPQTTKTHPGVIRRWVLRCRENSLCREKHSDPDRAEPDRTYFGHKPFGFQSLTVVIHGCDVS